MRENEITINSTPITTQQEIKIGKTIYNVKSVFQGSQTLEKVLKDWIVNKAVLSANN